MEPTYRWQFHISIMTDSHSLCESIDGVIRDNICRSAEHEPEHPLGSRIDDSLPFADSHGAVDVENRVIGLIVVNCLQTVGQGSDIRDTTVEAHGPAAR